jgi:cytochrome c553
VRTSLREPLVRFIVKHPWFTIGALVGVLLIGTTLIVLSGIVPVKASSGHWPMTARILDFAKLQSVRTWSLGITPPDLEDEALVVRGAAHYAIGCESCHGSPGGGVPAVMAAMTPPPPALSGEHLTRWNSAQLFTIVKHGIKFTGMPAWPVPQRDDEVWAVVAFLTRLPRMHSAEYRRLTGRGGATADAVAPAATSGQTDTPAPVRETCSRCHGADGTGREGAFPSLAGQKRDYLYASLRAFAERSRFSATMSEIAARLTDDQIRETAAYYEQLPGRTGNAAIDAPSASRGAAIAERGVTERSIPACVECHGPSVTLKNPAYPRLAGQHFRYLRLQLDLLQQRRRGGSPNVNLMHEVADHLAAQDMDDTASYFATLEVPPFPSR